MHPVMFTIPGWAFKVIVPLLILWGCYSIVVSVNRSSPAAKKDGDGDGAKGFQLPADSPFNALISVAIGLGVFAFASPVVVEGEGAARLVSLLKGFAHGPHWRAPWESLPRGPWRALLCACNSCKSTRRPVKRCCMEAIARWRRLEALRERLGPVAAG